MAHRAPAFNVQRPVWAEQNDYEVRTTVILTSTPLPCDRCVIVACQCWLPLGDSGIASRNANPIKESSGPDHQHDNFPILMLVRFSWILKWFGSSFSFLRINILRSWFIRAKTIANTDFVNHLACRFLFDARSLLGAVLRTSVQPGGRLRTWMQTWDDVGLLCSIW